MSPAEFNRYAEELKRTVCLERTVALLEASLEGKTREAARWQARYNALAAHVLDALHDLKAKLEIEG